MYHNCTSKQLFFNKHLECRYNFKKLEASVSSYNICIGKINITSASENCKGLYRLGFLKEKFNMYERFAGTKRGGCNDEVT